MHAPNLSLSPALAPLPLSLSFALLCSIGLETVESIFTDLDRNRHHCHRHHQKRMKISISAGQEHSQLDHWLQLCQKIRIFQVGCQRITSKKVTKLATTNIPTFSFDLLICYVKIISVVAIYDYYADKGKFPMLISGSRVLHMQYKYSCDFCFFFFFSFRFIFTICRRRIKFSGELGAVRSQEER